MRLFFNFYRKVISPVLHGLTTLIGGQPNAGCRFVPTCSEYSEQAIQKYGLLRGSFKTVVRVCHCHPYSKKSGWDPV